MKVCNQEHNLISGVSVSVIPGSRLRTLCICYGLNHRMETENTVEHCSAAWGGCILCEFGHKVMNPSTRYKSGNLIIISKQLMCVSLCTPYGRSGPYNEVNRTTLKSVLHLICKFRLNMTLSLMKLSTQTFVVDALHCNMLQWQQRVLSF